MRTHTTLLDTTWAEPCAGPCCRAGQSDPWMPRGVRIGQLSPAHSSSSLTPQCKRVRGIVVIQRQGTRTLREHRPSKSVRFLSVPSFPFLTYY